MKWLKQHQKGTLLSLYIRPGASKSEITGLHGDRLKIKIKALPMNGEANEALVEFLAQSLGISKSRVHLIRGDLSRQKDCLVELPVSEIMSKLSVKD